MILINPPSPFLENDRVFPYLGLMQLATSWNKKGLRTKIVDLTGNKQWEKKVDDISNGRERMFGITSTSAQFKYAYKINEILRQKDKITIIGGSHSSAIINLYNKGLFDQNTTTLMEFDYAVHGDGEKLSLMSKQFMELPITDITKEPIADRNLIDIQSYKFELDGRKATTIMSQRGCPFKCDFCSGREMEMYNKPRQRGIESVINEMDMLNKEYGYSAFMWYDDEVNINPGRLNELCERLTERDYKHRGFVRSDLLIRHPETLEKMYQAGFVELCSGIESGSDRVLGHIHKGTTSEINKNAARMIKEKGIRYKAFTIIGHPSETYQDIKMTKQILKEIKPESFDVTILTPYPGSKIYDNAKASNKFIGYSDEYNGLYFSRPDFSKDETFYKGTGIHPCFTRTDELSSEDLVNIRQELLCT